MLNHTIHIDPCDTLMTRVNRLLTTAVRILMARTAERDDSYARVGEFERIMNMNRPVIERICRSFASSQQDFEDLCQDTFVNIWRGLPGFDRRANLRTWIYRVTLNTCVSVYRRRPASQSYAPVDNLQIADDSDSAEQVRRSLWLYDQLARLPATDHAIAVMWLDGMAYEDIASVVGMNKNTVATRMHRIRQRLQKSSNL